MMELTRWLILTTWMVSLWHVSTGLKVSFRENCDYPVVDANTLTPEEFQKEFVKKSRPALLINAIGDDWPARKHWKWDRLEEVFAGIPLRVGQGPYPKKLMSIKQYLDLSEEMQQQGKEVPGVFQYGQVPTSWTLWAHKDECIPMVAFYAPSSQPIHDNFTTACTLLRNVQIPAFLSGNEAIDIPPNMVTHSGFLIGHKGSGIDYHRHQAAINLIFQGRKEWYMKLGDKLVNSFAELPADWKGLDSLYCNKHRSDPVCESLVKQQVMMNDEKMKDPKMEKYPTKKNTEYKSNEEKFAQHLGAFANQFVKTSQVTEELEDQSLVVHCIQNEGEVIFIPETIQHAVLNQENTIGMQMQWDSFKFKDQPTRNRYYRYLLHTLDPNEPDPDFEDVDFDEPVPIRNQQENDQYDEHDLL